jgi:hypothetical protein
MPTSEALVETDRPSRYLVQFCRHAESISHSGRHLHAGRGRTRPEEPHVEWSDTDGLVDFGWGKCVLRASAGTLTLRAEADDDENLRRVQDLVAGNLGRFGRRDHLAVEWRPADSR